MGRIRPALLWALFLVPLMVGCGTSANRASPTPGTSASTNVAMAPVPATISARIERSPRPARLIPRVVVLPPLPRVGTTATRTTRVSFQKDRIATGKPGNEAAFLQALSPEQRELFLKRLPEYEEFLQSLSSGSSSPGTGPTGQEYRGRRGIQALAEYFKNPPTPTGGTP